jgi:hypothetical protein
VTFYDAAASSKTMVGTECFSLQPTLLGLLPQLGLDNLREFGVQIERLQFPYIDVGGFIVPGRDPAAINPPGMECDRDVEAAGAGREGWGQAPREEAGPSAGARQRPPSPQAAPGAAPHAFGRELTTLNLDLSALVKFHPLARVVASTEMGIYLNIPIGVIPWLPIGARLTFELPLTPRERLSRRMQLSGVPDVRAWAVWEGGPLHGRLIKSHHQNPDRAICANMPGEWILGVHPLHDYVAFCVLWVAKVLHEHLVGFYPGPQHYPAAVRVRRDRPDEFCGCGKRERYRSCCRDNDRAQHPLVLWRESLLGRASYLDDLAWQGRPSGPPDALLSLGIPPL